MPWRVRLNDLLGRTSDGLNEPAVSNCAEGLGLGSSQESNLPVCKPVSSPERAAWAGGFLPEVHVVEEGIDPKAPDVGL